jgi:hypothetical protein
MNTQRALVPEYRDPRTLAASARRSFVRACVAIDRHARNSSEGLPEEILRRHWRDDDAVRVLKAVSSPMDTSGFWQAQNTVVLPALAPASASAQLMRRGRTISLTGVHTVKIPYIGSSGRPATVPFVGEGQPASVVDLATSALTLGPVHKLMIAASLTEELQAASNESAEMIIGEALSIATTQQVDGALFSANAATASSPAGILAGLTPLTSTAAAGATGVAADLGKLAQAISAAGIDPSNMIVIASANNAVQIKVLSSPKFTNEVLTSVAIPDGTIVAVAAEGFVTAYGSDAVTVETTKDGAWHFDDSAPVAVVAGVPTRSLYQQALLGLKIRGACTWLVHPGAVASMTGCDWV